MRILLLNYEFPPVGGGAATASAQIAAHMVRQGAEVAVLTSHLKGLPRVERRDGFTIHRVPAFRRHIDRCSVPEMGAYVASAIIPALRLASSLKPDLMHVFFGVPTGAVGLTVNRLKGIPYLLSLRGGDVPGFMGKELERMHALTMPLTKQVWGHASAIVANSRGLHDLAARTAPDRTIEIVPNGVDLDVFQTVQREKSAGEKVRLLFVGRLANQKGLSYLLQAIAGMTDDVRQKVELEIVGAGPEEERLRNMVAALGLGQVVRFSGWVPRSDIVSRYQRADVFVLPSFDEGLPNVVLEAMACGAAIVATDINGNRELVQNGANGFLIPPGDAEALGHVLSGVVRDPTALAKMGQMSRAMVERFSWRRTADSYLAISERILAARSVPILGAAEK